MSNFITIHIINELPWSNLNRDDTGLPKRTRQGGVQRGLLSSQSIKRGARADYERATGDRTVRSANLADFVKDRALEINSNLEEKEARRKANKAIGGLTKSDKSGGGDSPDSSKEAGRSAWLSAEELETLAQIIAEDQEIKIENFMDQGQTGSLAIAAFGRMFAAAPVLQLEAAIAVSPAVSTHQTVIETDYFSTGDDNPTKEQGKGAAYLGLAHYINGIFYRSVTIDREQLRLTWSGLDQADAQAKLEQMVTALIYGMPRGKKNSTAPFVAPAAVLIESQKYRTAYDFEKPVEPAEKGGYLEATLERFKAERAAAKRFDPENIGAPEAVAGTAESLDRFEIPVTDRPGIANQVAKWILES